MGIPVILHLGAHKTGTSLIQKFMRDRANLMRRNGIGFLRRSNGDQFIGWGKPETVSAGGPEIRKRIRQSSVLGDVAFVLSHENSLGRPFKDGAKHIYPDAAACIDRLATALEGEDLYAVHYIRSQPSFFESYYLQTIHEGRHHSFDQWSKPYEEISLSWAPVVDALRDRLGAERVIVKDFDAEIRKGQALFLQGFFASFGQPDPVRFNNFEYPAQRNISIGDRGLEMALRINPLVETPEQRKATRKFLQENFNNSQYQRPVLLSPERKSEMAANYAEENRELVQRSEQDFKAPAIRRPGLIRTVLAPILR